MNEFLILCNFFKHYKDNESNKWVNVGEFKCKDETIEIIKKSKKKYLNNN